MAFFLPSSRRSSDRLPPQTRHVTRRRAALAAHAAALLVLGHAQAQSLADITIRASPPSQVSGFEDVPPSKTPFNTTTIDQKTLQDIQAQRVSDALRLDASVTDSYNSPAYWDMLSVRGYRLDNRYNYRREGLPISAETMIPMDNKERIELFKGTSGIQAGTSAPGGLVNYVIKRPPTAKDGTIRSVSVNYGPGQNNGLGLDLGGRFGMDQALGYRINVAYENLNPYVHNTEGRRQLFALAMDWRLSSASKLEWEIERSQRQQFGVNGYSLLGNALPAPVDGTLNLTRQAWSVPAVFDGTTGSIRFKQQLAGDWLWTTQYGAQRLRTDDRLSFAFGCTPPKGDWIGDRYCPDGSFDVYDYRSDNERRLSDALQTSFAGVLQLGQFQHHLTLSALRQRQLDEMPTTQLYSFAGTAAGAGAAVPAQTAGTTSFNTNRREYATELALMDRLALTEKTTAWLGLRNTQSARGTNSLDPANPHPISATTNFTTPWIAITHDYAANHTLFASYGEGVELFAAPNNPHYTNAGQLLGVSRSKQTEVGAKGLQGPWSWNASLFHIQRPLAYDWKSERVVDGNEIHQGIDVGVQWTQGPWKLGTQLQSLNATISGATKDLSQNGQRPLNVPENTLRALAQYRFADIPGLRTDLRLSYEGPRRVTEDGSINLPSWTTLNFAVHYDTRIEGTRTRWSLAVDNLTDRHYWREAPKQFGHYYLYPGSPRTVWASMTASF